MDNNTSSFANRWVRQSHRWLSMVFMLTVVANFVAIARGAPPAWVTYAPLLPLALLLISGLYLFAVPYVTRWRGRSLEPHLPGSSG
ncbi:MAG TPA: hypothetical protein VK439_03875 [Rubrivivax sp.]|nr:hypothetical protein [Rubrivivax sp.]